MFGCQGAGHNPGVIRGSSAARDPFGCVLTLARVNGKPSTMTAKPVGSQRETKRARVPARVSYSSTSPQGTVKQYESTVENPDFALRAKSH